MESWLALFVRNYISLKDKQPFTILRGQRMFRKHVYGRALRNIRPRSTVELWFPILAAPLIASTKLFTYIYKLFAKHSIQTHFYFSENWCTHNAFTITSGIPMMIIANKNAIFQHHYHHHHHHHQTFDRQCHCGVQPDASDTAFYH